MASPADVPVALFAWRRPQHLTRVLDGLQRTGASQLYLFCDGPRRPEDEPLVEEVRRVARAVDWADVVLVEREENRGLARSIQDGVDHVFEHHDAGVFLEDDCVPVPAFYDVTRELLQRYVDERGAFSLSGWGPPVSLPRGYRFSHYWARRISSWGWATWRDRWQGFDLDTAALRREVRRRRLDPAAQASDLPGRLRRAPRDVWTVAWELCSMLRGGRTLWPVRPLVTNIGFDGSGENCGPAARFSDEGRLWDETVTLRPPPVELNPAITRAFDRVMAPVGRRERARNAARRLLRRLAPP